MATNNQVNVGLSGSSGTGNFAGVNAPTFISPITNSLKFNANTGLLDSNGNSILVLNPLSSAVNYVRVSNAATGQFPALAAIGGDANTTLFLQGSGTGGASVQGTTAVGNATAGYVGELISSVVTSGSPVSFSNSVVKDLTNITLTAGDWDLYGNIGFSGTTVLQAIGWMSLTTTSEPNASLYSNTQGATTATQLCITVPYLRVNVSTNTTLYLSGLVVGTGTLTGFGGVYARRVR